MRRAMTAAAAGALGLVLLLGPGTTLAAWQDTAEPSTTQITAGELRATVTADGPRTVAAATDGDGDTCPAETTGATEGGGVYVPAGTAGIVPGLRAQCWEHTVSNSVDSAVPATIALQLRSGGGGRYAAMRPYLRAAVESGGDLTEAGTGQWCAVPTELPNAYPLDEFPAYGDGAEPFHLQIVPVVANGELGPRDGAGELGVRLWSCRSESLVKAGAVKITAWRNDTRDRRDFGWPIPAGDGFPGQRLDPASKFGGELVKLHRSGRDANRDIRLSARQRYSRLVSSGRTRDNPTYAPPCEGLSCARFALNPGAAFANAFDPASGSGSADADTVTYLGAKRWTGIGTSTQTVSPLVRQPFTRTAEPPFVAGEGPTSTDGRQVQWVVMEWWGTSSAADDLVVEVLVR